MKKSVNNKIIILLTTVMTFVFTVSLTSCGESGDAPMGFKEISDEALTYHLYIPDEWTPDISTGFTSAYYSGRDPSNISMMAFELDTSITGIDSYWELYEKDLKAIFPDLEYVDKSDFKLDGVPAKQYIYIGSMSDFNYKFMQIVAIKNNQVYVFTYTATIDNYDKHIEDVIAIIDNFKFK
jgi:hypothetical protein